MALQNTDNFLVNRGGSSYKVEYSEINADATQAISDAATAQSTADTAASDASTALTAANAALPTSGGNMTGAVTNTETTITASAFHLPDGNFWLISSAITVPNPSGGVTGQSGLIRITTGPIVWSSNFKFPAGVAPTITNYPAIIPYYVQDATTILMGSVTEDIS